MRTSEKKEHPRTKFYHEYMRASENSLSQTLSTPTQKATVKVSKTSDSFSRRVRQDFPGISSVENSKFSDFFYNRKKLEKKACAKDRWTVSFSRYKTNVIDSNSKTPPSKFPKLQIRFLEGFDKISEAFRVNSVIFTIDVWYTIPRYETNVR